MNVLKLKFEKGEEREKQLELIREAATRSKILEEEERLRVIQLNQTAQLLHLYQSQDQNFIQTQTQLESWKKTLNCSTLPELSNLSSVNTFCTEWNQRNAQYCQNTEQIQNFFQETPQILELLETIRTFMASPPDSISVENLIEMRKTYHAVKEFQQEFINLSTYSILSDTRNLYDPEVGIVQQTIQSQMIDHYLWANLYSCPEYTEHFFNEAEFRFKLPDTLVLIPGVYRLVKLGYDPYSDSSPSYYQPGTDSFLQNQLEEYFEDKVTGSCEVDELSEAKREETPSSYAETILVKRKWKSMTTTMRNQGVREKSSGGSEALMLSVGQTTLTSPDSTHVTSNPQVETKAKEKKGAGQRGKGEEVRTKTGAELAKERERKEKEAFIPRGLDSTELNLRSHRILGGIYDFKLIQLPPQPRELTTELQTWTLHDIQSTSRGILTEISFEADYSPPFSSSDPSHQLKPTPEEMEREAKRQEEEFQKLILVEINVSKSAIWFEPPTIVRWKSDKQIWSTEGFFDPRFNESSLQLSFRMSKFGVIGLGHHRWSNLPYQSWELRPLEQNGVSIILMAAVAVLELTVKDDLVCLSSLQNVGNSELVEEAVIGKYMKPKELIQVLRCYGLDVFPDLDSYAYVDGILVKYRECEEHLYYCLAIICCAYNCHWSRWNLLAGRAKMVYQIRERLGNTTPGNYHMVLNTSRSVSLIDCTEVSPNYSEEPIGEYQYHADLLHLVESIGSEEAKAKMTLATGQFVETVRIILVAIKFLSFA